MTPQKKRGGQSRGGRMDRASGGGRASRTRKRKRAESSGSRILLNFLSHRIPVYSISEFLLPLEPAERFLKAAGAYQVEVKTGESAYQQSAETQPLILVERGLIVLSLTLGGHLKTGHTWSGQNRPYESAGT